MTASAMVRAGGYDWIGPGRERESESRICLALDAGQIVAGGGAVWRVTEVVRAPFEAAPDE